MCFPQTPLYSIALSLRYFDELLHGIYSWWESETLVMYVLHYTNDTFLVYRCVEVNGHPKYDTSQWKDPRYIEWRAARGVIASTTLSRWRRLRDRWEAEPNHPQRSCCRNRWGKNRLCSCQTFPTGGSQEKAEASDENQNVLWASHSVSSIIILLFLYRYLVS